MTTETETAKAPVKAAVKNREPYQQAYYPPVPTPFTRYFRTSLLWQFFRFWIINFKIFKLLAKSQG